MRSHDREPKQDGGAAYLDSGAHLEEYRLLALERWDAESALQYLDQTLGEARHQLDWEEEKKLFLLYNYLKWQNSKQSDPTLYRAAKKFEEQLVLYGYNVYVPVAVRIALREDRYGRAEDLTQKSFFPLGRLVRDCDPLNGTFEVQIITTVRRLAIDMYRRSERESRNGMLFTDVDVQELGHVEELALDLDDVNPVQAAIHREQLAIVGALWPQVLAMLGEGFRPLLEALKLQLEGKTNEEIATIQNVPIGTVKSRLHAARRKLKEIIENDSKRFGVLKEIVEKEKE